MLKLKRILIRLVCMVCLLGLMAVGAAATTEEIPFVMETIVNPLYADVISEEDIADFSAAPMMLAEEVYYTSVEEAAAELARQMAARNESISICYQSPVAYPYLHRDLFNTAMEHTGIPGHGDNLKYQYSSASYGTGGYIEDGVYYLTATFDMHYFTTAEQEAELDAAVDSLLTGLDLDGKTNLQKIKIIYDWICDNVTYDYDGLEDDTDDLEYSAYDALVNRSAVCQGYANLLYRLMLEVDIDCRMVNGETPGGGHAWNIIQIGDLYYYADATWDAEWGYTYFLKGSVNFEKDHFPRDPFKTESFMTAHPISKDDYVLEVANGTCGEGVNWSLNNVGTLTISGNGAMTDYSGREETPWWDYYFDVQKVVIEGGVTRIGNNAFRTFQFDEVEIGEGVQEIGEGAFGNCSYLTTVHIPDSVEKIEFTAFYNNTALYSVTGGMGVKEYGQYAFGDCTALTSFVFPDQLKQIDYCVLMNCTGLVTVTLGKNLTLINGYAFDGCVALDHVLFKGTDAQWAAIDFTNNNEPLVAATCHTNATGSEVTRAASCVKEGYSCSVCEADFASVVKPVDEHHTYASGICSVCGWIEGMEYTIENGEVTITDYSGSVTKVTIPAAMDGFAVTAIDNMAFMGDTGVVKVIVPDSVTSLGASAFVYSDTLEEVVIGNAVTQIKDYTFCECYELKKVRLPGTLTAIGNQAFLYATNLETVVFCGTESQWNEISIGTHNDPLTTATVQYHEYVDDVCVYCGVANDVHTVHTYDQSIVHEDYLVSAANCVSGAVYHKSCECSAVGEETFVNGEPDLTKHDLTQHEAKTPACTEIGWNAYEDCARCDYTTYEELPAADHAYENWHIEKQPTCKETGTLVLDCTYCGDVKQSATLGKTNHIYKSVVTEPTATSQGYTTHTCTACGDSYVDSYTDPVEAEALIGGVAYASIADALEAATSGQTVTLTANADATGKTLFIKSGVTLDLGAYTLKADGLIGLSGSTITGATREDAASGAKLYVDRTNIVLSEIAPDGTSGWKVIPVWNGDHYVFARAMIYNPKFSKNTAANSAKVEFIPTFNSFVKQNLFNDGCDDNDVSIIITVVYMEGDIKVTREYFYTTPMVVASMLQSRSMFAEMTGCNQLTGLQFQISIVTEAGPVVSSAVYTY